MGFIAPQPIPETSEAITNTLKINKKYHRNAVKIIKYFENVLSFILIFYNTPGDPRKLRDTVKSNDWKKKTKKNILIYQIEHVN